MLNEGTSKIVALGGGAGLDALLTGLHRRGVWVRAIVPLIDDGASTGRLQNDLDIPLTADLRNALIALSDADPHIGDLFRYQFDASILKGLNFGDLFLAVLTRLTGDLSSALERARVVLSVKGDVIPANQIKVTLVAEHPDASKSTGSDAVTWSRKAIRRIRLSPRPPSISAEIRRALAEADLVCVGPGALYTSLAPCLLVPGMVEAINRSPGRVVYVANLMTQPGHTAGFDLEDHVRVLMDLAPGLRIDAVLQHGEAFTPEQIEPYAREGCVPVRHSRPGDAVAGVPVHRAVLVETGVPVRHSPRGLADAVLGMVLHEEGEQA